MISTSRLLAVSCALALALMLGACESSGTSSSNVRVYGSIYYGYGYYNPWYWRHYWYRPPYWGPPGYRPPIYRPPRPEHPIARPPIQNPATRPAAPQRPGFRFCPFGWRRSRPALPSGRLLSVTQAFAGARNDGLMDFLIYPFSLFLFYIFYLQTQSGGGAAATARRPRARADATRSSL